jgi:hypothetical protein
VRVAADFSRCEPIFFEPMDDETLFRAKLREGRLVQLDHDGILVVKPLPAVGLSGDGWSTAAR